MKRYRSLLFGLLLVGSAVCDTPRGFQSNYIAHGVESNSPSFSYASNPFLNGGYTNDINAFIADQARQNEMDLSKNLFLKHMITDAVASSSANVDQFSGPEYLPPLQRVKIYCSGPQVCVYKGSCQNGYFTQQNLLSSKKDCDSDNEVCCSYRPPPTQPRPQQCSGNDYSCVTQNNCINGYIQPRGSQKTASIKPAPHCYAPEICCRIPEPESTVLTDDGYVVRVPDQPFVVPTNRPYQPTKTPYQPTKSPYQPTQSPYQPTKSPYQPTQSPYQPTKSPYQPTLSPYQPTKSPYQPTQSPYQPTPSQYQPTKVPYQPTQSPYQPTKSPYQPTQSPYQPTQKPYQPTQSPYQPTKSPYQPTEKPYQPTQSPYQPTQSPYQPTQSPYQPTQSPYQPTKSPYQPTQSPYQPTQSPYQPTQSPYQPTQSPYQPTKSPYQPTQSPFQPTQSPYQPTQSPYQPTQSPYQPTQSPYQPTQKPYQPTQSPYQPTKSPYQPTQSPYQPTQSPYQPTKSPYQPTKSPYQPTQKPYQPTQYPYQPTEKPYQPTQSPYQPTQKPYQPTEKPYQPTQKPYYPTQKPYQPSRTPLITQTYLPPTSRPYVPDRQPQPSDTNPTRVPATRRPTKGDGILSQPIYPGNQLEESRPPSKCAAALNCTEVQYCTSTGFISKTPVILTKDQELYRVPLTNCRHESRGFIGKCCRDPDYTDPWPVTQLGRYDAALFGDDGSYKPNGNGKPRTQVAQPSIIRGEAIKGLPIGKNQIQTNGFCTTRNFNGSPKGPGKDDAAFSEYPWQAMVLLESTKSLLCGGAIVGDDLVLTAAHCVKGQKPFDVLIKGGEWKLGRDEEPLNFQISRVKKIEIHPSYDATTLSNDLAILHLDSKLKFEQHIAPICIDDIEPTPSDECVTTGWGKEVLKVHAQDAIMKHSPVSMLPSNECEKQSDGYRYQKGSSLCGITSIDACSVDPGSALACANKRGHYVLKGLYSVEEQCGPGRIVTFSKIDSKWINKATGGKSTYTPDTSASNALVSRVKSPFYLPPSF